MKVRAIVSITLRVVVACCSLLVGLAACSGGDPAETGGEVSLAVTAQYKAGDTIQVEALTSKSTPNPQLENNGTTLGFFDVGTSFCFDNVDFTGVTGLDLRLAAANLGGVVSVRQDTPTGTEIGRYTVSTTTGGWGTWQTRSMTLSASSGVHSLCFRGESGYGILNLDWLKLNGTSASYRAGDTVQVEALTLKSTPNPQLENNNTTLGFFDAGTWFCFGGVDVSGVTSIDLRMAAANVGGVLSVRLDSNAGNEVGRFTVSTSTGGWSTWQTRTLTLSASSGVHSLCFRGESGSGILNLDWFKLNSGSATRYRLGDTLQAEAFSSKSSPNPQLENNNTDLGWFDAGTWFCFDGVDTTGVTSLELRIAAPSSGGVFSARLDSSSGAELGRSTVSATGGWSAWQTQTMSVAGASGVHTLC
ncbi:MAG TPA: carbohydrate-binding protein, partial [Polyangiaceae bacterium]|nr:carbohydrate-binding protein [Polyangiaceae bacterium]